MTIEIVRCELSAYDSAIRTIREAVFVNEQGVPKELEMDERDALCRHVLALVDGYPAGTARLDILKDGKIGRLAVLPQFRRRSLGKRLMYEIEAIAAAHRLPSVWCHAQKVAVPFYQSIGYTRNGDNFLEAGIIHCKMSKSLLKRTD